MSGLSDDHLARLASVLAKHHTRATGLGEWCCACSPREWRPTARRPQHLADALAPVVAAIADEAAAEANAVRDRKFGNLRWLEGHEQGLKDADARYAALVYKVRALANEWERFDCVELPEAVPAHVDVPDDFEAGIHDAAASLRALLDGDA